MKRAILPQPPNPDDAAFRNNPLGYGRAVYRWMNETKSKLEDASFVNDTPLDQQFVISSYTLATSLSGTSSVGDIANFLCSLVTAFQKKGIVKNISINT